MATITNTDTINEVIRGGRLQTGRDKIPTELTNQVVPVMEVNPKLLKRVDIVRTLGVTNSTAGTVYTAPTDKDFYLCGASLSVIKDVTSTSVVSAITAIVNGGTADTRRILAISSISLTAQQNNAFCNFSPPIKIDKGGAITVTNSTNVANIRADGCIWGYLEDIKD